MSQHTLVSKREIQDTIKATVNLAASLGGWTPEAALVINALCQAWGIKPNLPPVHLDGAIIQAGSSPNDNKQHRAPAAHLG